MPTDYTVPGISDERQAILGSSFRPNVLPCRIRCLTLGGQEETGGASHSENCLDCWVALKAVLPCNRVSWGVDVPQGMRPPASMHPLQTATDVV